MGLLEDIEAEPEIIYELIITAINFLSIIANILLIITITRTKSMRTKTNIYILNVSIADLLTLLVLLIYYADKRLLNYTKRLDNYKHIQCILSNLEVSLQILTMIFVIVLLTNLLFSLQGIVLVVMWNLVLIVFYVNVLYCKDELSFIQAAIYVSFISCLFLILITKYYLRFKNRGDVSRDSAFRLNFATIFMCLCLSSWLINIMAEFTLNGSVFKHFVLAFGTSVKVGKNIALSLYLIRFNEMFKESFLGLFNCKIVQINHSINYSNDQTSIDFSDRNEKT